MCLLITAFAAVITTVIWYFSKNRKEMKLGWLALMFWGATIMWTVDGFFSVAGAEPFFDVSADDALLGLVIILCGFITWIINIIISDPKDVFAAMKRSKA